MLWRDSELEHEPRCGQIAYSPSSRLTSLPNPPCPYLVCLVKDPAHDPDC